MPLILNIDTATELASICIARDGIAVAFEENSNQKDHASWLHQAIEKILHEHQVAIKELGAIAITSGPGSYTGLRVAMATAKGLCYALNIPLISENTLRVMAFAAKRNDNGLNDPVNTLYCPMIDARRMEVFTALFEPGLRELMPSQAIVLNENLFLNYLETCQVLFFGSGASKFQSLISHKNAVFPQVRMSAANLATLSNEKFLRNEFDDIAYSEPLYLKEFYTPAKK